MELALPAMPVSPNGAPADRIDRGPKLPRKPIPRTAFATVRETRTCNAVPLGEWFAAAVKGLGPAALLHDAIGECELPDILLPWPSISDVAR